MKNLIIRTDVYTSAVHTHFCQKEERKTRHVETKDLPARITNKRRAVTPFSTGMGQITIEVRKTFTRDPTVLSEGTDVLLRRRRNDRPLAPTRLEDLRREKNFRSSSYSPETVRRKECKTPGLRSVRVPLPNYVPSENPDGILRCTHTRLRERSARGRKG